MKRAALFFLDEILPRVNWVGIRVVIYVAIYHFAQETITAGWKLGIWG